MNELTKEQMTQTVKKVILDRVSSPEIRIVGMMDPGFLDCDPELKSLTLAFHVKQWELNPHGIMHGGLIATAFDTSFGTLTHSIVLDRIITTVELSTSFLKPVPLDDTLIIKVKANSVGRTIISLTGEATLKSTNKLVATASATFMLLGPRA